MVSMIIDPFRLTLLTSVDNLRQLCESGVSHARVKSKTLHSLNLDLITLCDGVLAAWFSNMPSWIYWSCHRSPTFPSPNYD